MNELLKILDLEGIRILVIQMSEVIRISVVVPSSVRLSRQVAKPLEFGSLQLVQFRTYVMVYVF
jgi:hypothetical protein